MPDPANLNEVFRDLVRVLTRQQESHTRLEERVGELSERARVVELECRQIRDMIDGMAGTSERIAVFEDRAKREERLNETLMARLDRLEEKLQGLYIRVALISGGIAIIPAVISIVMMLTR